MTPPASGRAFRLRLSALLFHLSGSASARRSQETPSVYAGFRAGGAAANSRWWSTATPPERHHRKRLHAGGVLGLSGAPSGATLNRWYRALPPANRRGAIGAHVAWVRLRAVSSLRFSARAVTRLRMTLND